MTRLFMRPSLLLCEVIVLALALGFTLVRLHNAQTREKLAWQERTLWDAMRRRVSVHQTGTVPQLLAELSRQARVPITVREALFDQIGLSAQTAFELDVRDVPLRGALDRLIMLMRPYMPTADYDEDNGQIVVGPAREIGTDPLPIRIYDISDLIRDGLAHTSAKPSSNSGTVPPGLTSIDPVFGHPEWQVQEQRDEIMRLLMDLADPDTWRDNGGSQGSMRCLGGCVIVQAAPDVHLQIQVILRAGRAADPAR